VFAKLAKAELALMSSRRDKNGELSNKESSLCIIEKLSISVETENIY